MCTYIFFPEKISSLLTNSFIEILLMAVSDSVSPFSESFSGSLSGVNYSLSNYMTHTYDSYLS